ncbi:MAG: hypothetical protein EB060_02160 [Proteobacteria bacterium]|nr:hypothetical protein [Pseudomonadota bacterium]
MITDLTPYRKYVDKFDLTEDQKLELVNALSTIVETIYDKVLGINQMPLKNREVDSPKRNVKMRGEHEKCSGA